MCWKVSVKLAPSENRTAAPVSPAYNYRCDRIAWAVSLQVTGACAANRIAEADIEQLGGWGTKLGTVTDCVAAALERGGRTEAEPCPLQKSYEWSAQV